MPNQYVNKVVQSDGTTLIDITDTTAVASDVAQGKYFYAATGEKLQGTASGGTAAISVVDTLDSHGGTIREITALDISDTTAVASDVAQGKYFYTAAGVKTVGTASGGSSGQSLTGTFVGNNGITAQIQCSFAPDVIYINGDLSGDLTNRGVNSITIVKDTSIYISSDTSTSSSSTSVTYYASDITGYNESDSTSPHATYSSGVLTIDMVNNTSSNRFTSGITYSYELSTLGSGSGTPSATQHSIYFEFTDNTDATINAWYDSSFISDAITATAPTTYGQKTVDSASLDGVTWYTRPTETWETMLDGNVAWNKDDNNDYPYCWISSLDNVSIPNDSVWRITYDNVEYRLTAVSGKIGNPKWTKGTDDGTNVPFVFENYGWGAWTGGLNVPNVDSTYYFKIERLVTS